MRSRVLSLRRLSATGYELAFAREGLDFRAGQLVTIHGRNLLEDRSYSICSGEGDEALTILFRLIPDGQLTPQLAALRPGAEIDVSGPFGEFVLRDKARPVVFVATGTGIAPCRSYLRTHPDLHLTVIHGVRAAEDLFYRDEFAGVPYHPCVSSGGEGVFAGRVTDFCRGAPLPDGALFHLCGANGMFYDMRDVLSARGIPPGDIFTEAYYYGGDE